MADYSDYTPSRKKQPDSSAPRQNGSAGSPRRGHRFAFLIRLIILMLLLAVLRTASCFSAEDRDPPELPALPSIEEFHDSLALPEMPEELKNFLSGSDLG